MRDELPSGTVTFLFTDVEGSTRLLHELGAEKYAEALAEHRRLIREACVRHHGVEVDTQGDAFLFAFPTAPGALAGARELTEALASGPIQVRIGLHTGTPLLTEEGYVGDDVHFGARVAASGHGGQVLLSASTVATIEPSNRLLQGGSLLDLGEHRLKDIESAVSIFQIGEGSFPPLKTISNTNLPRPASSFVGRKQELQEVLARVEAGARLLTLSGPGGSGKTRLALEAAATLVPAYKAGVFWVGLASLRDPALVAETISQTLGAKDGLAEHIGEREMLLLLDNLEQVIEAAPELSSLLSACPNLTLIGTSRELLRVQGEVEYSVPPLAEPEAVALFCERAQLEPTEEIAELCARLDSLPLAVELAAARTKALSPAQILERLAQRLDLLKGGRDADPRQQTLRATIEWSYDLLSPDERELFARLSVFAGGCTLEAAEEVCDADLDTLQSLAEKSLLRFSNERYWMLETIREFAGEKLGDMSAAETDRRHGEYFGDLACRLGGQQLWIGSDVGLVERLGLDMANIRSALGQLSSAGKGGPLLETTCALVPYWLMRGPVQEGRIWLERALALAGTEDSALRCRALTNAADLTWALGDLDRARAYATESLAVAERIGEPLAISQALHDLGEIAMQEEKYDAARDLFEKAILRAREADYPAPGSIGNLADIAFAQGDYSRAHELSLEASEIFRRLGNKRGLSIALFNLACTAVYEADLEGASSCLRESLEVCREQRDTAGAAYGMEACAAILVRLDRAVDAARFLGVARVLFDEIGATQELTMRRMHEDTMRLVGAQLPVGELSEAEQSGARLSRDEALDLALDSLD